MRMALKRSATAVRPSSCALAARLFVALMLTAVIGCSVRGRATTQAPAEKAAHAAPVSSAPAARVQEAAFTEDSDGARLVLSANAPILYTAYEPRPDLLVLDLPGMGIDEKFTAPAASGTLVQSVRVEPITEMGKQMTRLTIAHREGTRYDVRSLGQGLALSFESPEQVAASSAAAPSPAEPAVTTASLPPAGRANETASAAHSASLRGETAHALEEVRATSVDGEVVVALLGDGYFQAKDFALENPPRIVIDLPGVRNEVRRRALPVKSELVSRVRVSQFQTSPEMVTRIVLDLTRPAPHAIRMDGERMSVVVGASAALAAAPAPAPESHPVASAPRPSRTEIAAAPVEILPSPPASAPEPSKSAAVAPAPAPSESSSSIPSVPAETPAHVDASMPAHATGPAAPAPAPAPVREAAAAPPPVSAPSMSEPAVRARADESIRASSGETRSRLPGVRQAKRSSKTPPVPVPAKPASSSRDEALFEAAAAVLQQEDGARPAPTANASAYQPRTISETQTQFTGEPISLDLKDADIKDVFRTISQLTQLNIVVDPEVRGTVTVQLEDVPWDQALDLILKQNGLGYVLENNIMRIATTAKLQAEQSDRARLAEARQAAEPTRTLIKKLSYARAQEVLGTIKSVMSKRGDIVVDLRTNTLIIREIPTYLPAVLQLIDQLDTATPQVMIESRIVETTKSLGRSLGISWGVNGAADVAHGNTTNLVFPNNITGSGTVGLANGPTVASVRLGNILNTFNLDIALTAAENQGLLKIISSPKVAALTNTAASIQSGVQIPVQTNVNNTTTVIYVDATLRLSVTPQITNEGTILLDVSVSKREPAVALNLSLGNNVPLTIREYRGQVLVRDGGTTVIGGIFQINDQDQNNMIPGLWKIPILGNLFRNKTRTEKHDELLIFITPRILRS